MKWVARSSMCLLNESFTSKGSLMTKLSQSLHNFWWLLSDIRSGVEDLWFICVETLCGSIQRQAVKECFKTRIKGRRCIGLVWSVAIQSWVSSNWTRRSPNCSIILEVGSTCSVNSNDLSTESRGIPYSQRLLLDVWLLTFSLNIQLKLASERWSAASTELQIVSNCLVRTLTMSKTKLLRLMAKTSRTAAGSQQRNNQNRRVAALAIQNWRLRTLNGMSWLMLHRESASSATPTAQSSLQKLLHQRWARRWCSLQVINH